MKVQYVNAILNAVKEVFVSMLGMSVRFENPINKTTFHPSYEICSIIKMRGDLSCWIVFSYPEEIAKFVASEMLDEDFSDINDQAVDAICEIANMVTGVADTDLEMENVSYAKYLKPKMERKDLNWQKKKTPT